MNYPKGARAPMHDIHIPASFVLKNIY